MRISQVKVSNYRGIKECNFSLSPFVCIIGENNAGKSTVLLALSLLSTGTKLSESDFYDVDYPISIEAIFIDVTDNDLTRIEAEHRDRLAEIIYDNKLILVRKYSNAGQSTELLCKRLVPKDSRFDRAIIDDLLKGKKAGEIKKVIEEHLPDYVTKFEGVSTQTAAKEIVQQIIKDFPSDKLEFKEAPLPTGISASITRLLPEPVLIPAVKDVTDEVKTKESATFGKLIGILLKNIEKAEEVQKIIESFKTLHSFLNRNTDTNGFVIDNRLPQVIEIETLLKTYLQENFPKIDLELQIPHPELKHVFSTAQILLDDGIKDTVETKGDGVKRAVTFSLLRSYVELKRKYSNEASEESSKNERPYLFLFEEPELYLHPSAQRILFDALAKLAEEYQVVVTTHSPLFFSPTATGTFVKIIKQYPPGAKPYGKVIAVDFLSDMRRKDAFQIICFENSSAAFFANKVLLVEGDSDLCYFKHVAKVINDNWDFDARNIPVIRINGKSNVKRFKEFFEEFNVEVHVILDIDALLDDFSKLGIEDPDLNSLGKELIKVLDEIAEKDEIKIEMSKDKIKDIVRKYSWKQRYGRIKEIAACLTEGRPLTLEELFELGCLFPEENDMKRLEVLQQNFLIDQKEKLLSKLREHKIYILSQGTVEKYYPPNVTGMDKPSMALCACSLVSRPEDVLSICPNVEEGSQSVPEFHAIFSRIFA